MSNKKAPSGGLDLAANKQQPSTYNATRVPSIPLWQQASGRWIGILSSLAPSLLPALEKPGRHVPCPVHGGKDGFRVFLKVKECGSGICNTYGKFPNGFKLLAWVNGWNAKNSAYKAVSEYLNPSAGYALPAINRMASSDKPTDWAKRQHQVAKVLQGCISLHDVKAQPVHAYLQSRGLAKISESPPGTLLAHPALEYWENGQLLGYFPAMVAPVVDAEGQTVSLHRTFLILEGGKAPVTSPKKLMQVCQPGGLSGAAIRLYSADRATLAVGEGIETMLAVRLATGLPVWACVSAHGLETFIPPAGVSKVLAMADLDKSGRGEEAASRLVGNLLRQGLDARLVLPTGPIPPNTKGIDWLDVWQQEQPDHERN